MAKAKKTDKGEKAPLQPSVTKKKVGKEKGGFVGGQHFQPGFLRRVLFPALVLFLVSSALIIKPPALIMSWTMK